jgi:hypothetical protein
MVIMSQYHILLGMITDQTVVPFTDAHAWLNGILNGQAVAAAPPGALQGGL